MQVSQISETLYISFSYQDTDKLQDISNVIKSLLEQKSSELQEVGSHKLELISESQNMIVDSTLIEKKNNMASNVSTLKTQLQTLKAGMTPEQLAVFNSDIEEIRGEKEETEEAPCLQESAIFADTTLICFSTVRFFFLLFFTFNIILSITDFRGSCPGIIKMKPES